MAPSLFSIRYRPLSRTKNDIRLLTILPPNGPLVRCTLDHFSLDTFSQTHHANEFDEQAKVVKWLEAQKTGNSNPEQSIPSIAQAARDPLKPLPRREPVLRTSELGYMALSYTWGKDCQKQSIVVNGVKMKVSKNLTLALHALQEMDILQGSKLWVDVLCINQKDDKEREREVQRMHQIYALAQRVVVWLGPQEHSSDKVIDFLCRIYMNGNRKQRISLAALGKPVLELNRAGLESTQQFFLRQYFRRVWILQELAAGASNALVICGTCQVPWAVISYGAEVLRKPLYWLVANFPANRMERNTFNCALRRICRLNALIRQGDSNPFKKVSEIFDLGVTSQATDQRDKIYGLMGLMQSSISSKIKPNYNKVTRHVHFDFAKAFIEAIGCLDIIYLGSLKRTSCPDPTWIPNWNSNRQRTVLSFETAMSFRASGETFARAAVFRDSKYLSCRGMLFDVIHLNACYRPLMKNTSCAASYVKPPYALPEDRNANMDHLEGYLQKTLTMAYLPPEKGCSGALDRQVPVFTIPWYEDTSKPETWDKHKWGDCLEMHKIPFCIFQQFRLRHAEFHLNGHKFKDFFPPSVTDCEDSKKMGQILENMATTLSHRRLVGTKGGFLGLATENVRDRDLIFILIGCRFPVVLRPQGEYYRVVGEIYVYGIMNGEAMEVLEQGKCTLQEIVLY